MIEVDDASFCYGGRTALSGVSLRLAPGTRVVLLGRNGSGKSTLGRLLNGALAPSAGRVSVDGLVVGEAAPHDLARLVGYVRQDPRNQIVSALVEDEVAFGPRSLGLDRSDVDERVSEALSACGIESLRGRMTTELSGGQQQLLALAGVLAMRPRYLVLDEAGSQLDESSRRLLAGVVDALVASGVGVLEIAHAPESLFGADRVVVLDGGEVAWEGSATGFLSDEGALARSGLDADPLARVLSRAAGRGYALGASLDVTELLAYVRHSEIGLPSGAGERTRSHALEASGLCVSYQGVEALSEADVSAAGLTLVLGRSGSGKTTLARALVGVLEPDAGLVALDGEPVRAGRVGLSFQRAEDQVFCETVLEDIAYGPRARGLGEAAAQGAARLAASRTGVGEELLERSPFELSGGQMRRVALAGVLAGRPDAYVLDEPTAGLDAPARRELRAVVRGLVDDGFPVVVVTHDAGEWLGEADDVVFLGDGRVRAHVVASEAATDVSPYEAAGLEPPTLVRLRAALGQPRAPRRGEARSDPRARRAEPAPRTSRRRHARALGSFVPGSTRAHRADSRVKLVLLVMASIASFAAPAPRGLAVAALGLVLALLASRTSPRQVLRALRPAALVLLFALVANAVVLVGQPGLSSAGLARGATAVARIALVVGFALVFSSTTVPPAISDAIAWLMSPLRALGVPVGGVSTAASVALRFIPITAEEVERIRCAQRARGADLDGGGVRSRLRGWAQVLVPLVVGLFRRADELAGAMADRCYTGEQTSLARPLRARDVALLACGLAWAVAAAVLA